MELELRRRVSAGGPPRFAALATPAAGTPTRNADASQPTILVVEDEAAAARVLEIMLQRAGYHVVTAASLAGARQTLATLQPSAVLLDIQLPDGSGLELAEELALRTTAIPVVVLSGRGRRRILSDLRSRSG
jgi:CheY-like chemotaxis protein